MKTMMLFFLMMSVIGCSSSISDSKTSRDNPIMESATSHKGIARVQQKGIEHEFYFLDFDKSESSLRFRAKIKNTLKKNIEFNLKDVVLVIKTTEEGKPLQWSIPARDASLADQDLLKQIADLEKQNKNTELLVSNLAPGIKANREKELKSIKERRKELADKSFYTSSLVSGEVITGLMYFEISNDKFLSSPNSSLQIMVKGQKSNEIYLSK